MGRRSEWYKSFSKLSFKQTTIDRILLDGRGKKQFSPKDREAFDKYARAHFDKRPILENRETARKIGIEASSTYPKENLVNAILDAIWGLQYFSDERDALEYPTVSRFLIDSEVALLADYYCGSFIAGEEVTGVFEEQEGGFGIIRTQADGPSVYDCFVPRRLVSEYLLQNGDKVTGRMRYVKNCQSMGMFFVDEVNSLPANKDGYRDEVLASRNKVSVTPFERVILGGDENSSFVNLLNLVCPFALGQSLLVSYSGRMNGQKQLLEVVSALSRCGKFDEIITVSVGLNSLDTKKLATSGVAMISGWKQTEHNATVLSCAIDGAQTRAKQGENIAIVFADLDGALKSESEVSYAIDGAKKYLDGGSVSVIAFCDNESTNGNYSTAKRVSQAEMRVRFKPFNDTYEVDYERSYSFAQVELTQEESQAREKLLTTGVVTEQKQSYQRFVSSVAER